MCWCFITACQKTWYKLGFCETCFGVKQIFLYKKLNVKMFIVVF